MVTKGEWLGRRIAHDCVEVLRAEVAGFENCCIVTTGPQIGIREAWCPEAQYVLKREDLAIGRKFDSGIARAAWPMEDHSKPVEDHSKPGKPSYHPIGGGRYGLIPFESLSTKITNLWLAGRIIGADTAAMVPYGLWELPSPLDKLPVWLQRSSLNKMNRLKHTK